MTEKLLTGTLNLNKKKKEKRRRSQYDFDKVIEVNKTGGNFALVLFTLLTEVILCFYSYWLQFLSKWRDCGA